jgi:CsoR family transcriptional regulator, copper-sensing transcriptional repressor
MTKTSLRTRKPSEPDCHHKTASALTEPDHARNIDKRLARIEGQIGGLRRMVAEGRYCIDVLRQIQAAQESLKSTSAILLEAHVRSCVHDAFSAGQPQRKETVLKELADLIARK